MSAKVPTLSESGWVENIAEKADHLVSYYFVAEESQTQLYPGHVVSLPAQIQAFGHDPLELRLKIRNDLERYLRPYFDNVVIDVVTDLPVPTDPNRINVTVSCTLIEKGERYSLGRLITTINSKIIEIVNINNNIGG